MARRTVFGQREVVLTNYVDVVLGLLLALAFIRGFTGGLWRSVFSLASTGAAFVGAYLVTGPVVGMIERNYGVLGGMASWWNSLFGSVPGLGLPYDPSTFDQAFSAAGGSGWAEVFKGALHQNTEAVQAVAGPNPTWGTVLGLALARLVLSAAVFFILLAILRLLCNLFVGSLAFGPPSSFAVRFLGGVLETAIAAVWLSILAGVLYPVLNAGFLGGVAEATASSTVMAGLLGVYRVLWPALIARIK